MATGHDEGTDVDRNNGDESGRELQPSEPGRQDGVACARLGEAVLPVYHGGIEPWSSQSLVDEWLVLLGCNCSQSVADDSGPDQRLHRLDPNRKPCTSHFASPIEA